MLITTKCPFCAVEMDPQDITAEQTEYLCPKCGRTWFEIETSDGPALQSKPIAVKLKKWPPEEGDAISEIMQTAKEAGGLTEEERGGPELPRAKYRIEPQATGSLTDPHSSRGSR